MKRKKAGESLEKRLQVYEALERGELTAGQVIAQMRRALGITQAEFAERIGIAARSLIDFEREVGNPTLETMQKIGRPFGLVVSYRRRKQQ